MDEPAVKRAYETYAPVVYSRCRRILRDEQAARDVTQEVFERCLRHRDELREGQELLGWLYRTATNACLNSLRDARVRRAREQELSLTAPVASEQRPGPAEVLGLLAGLDERTQAVVLYVYVDGMTQPEAARVAKVTDRTVRNCLARFVAHGRRQLGLEPKEESDDLSL